MLATLSGVDPQASELVKLRVFAGMTIEEVAQYQGISPHGQAIMGLCACLAHAGDGHGTERDPGRT